MLRKKMCRDGRVSGRVSMVMLYPGRREPERMLRVYAGPKGIQVGACWEYLYRPVEQTLNGIVRLQAYRRDDNTAKLGWEALMSSGDFECLSVV